LFTAATYNPRFDLIPEVPIFVAVLITTEVIAYYVFFREIGAVRRQAKTAQELAVWQGQYKQLSRTMEETRRLRHGLRHHLNTLSALNAQGNQEEIGSYLKRCGTVYDQLEKQRFSGDPVVDSVLEYYLTQAGEEGVLVVHRVSLEGLTGVEAMDMTVLLGNCLENALEALRELPEENWRLSIEMVRSGAALLVRIRNSSKEAAGGAFAGWEAFSSRKEEGRQGLGLRSVAAISRPAPWNPRQFQGNRPPGAAAPTWRISIIKCAVGHSQIKPPLDYAGKSCYTARKGAGLCTF